MIYAIVPYVDSIEFLEGVRCVDRDFHRHPDPVVYFVYYEGLPGEMSELMGVESCGLVFCLSRCVEGKPADLRQWLYDRDILKNLPWGYYVNCAKGVWHEEDGGK